VRRGGSFNFRPLVVVDANILVGATLGRGWSGLRDAAAALALIVPERAFEEAAKRTAHLQRAQGLAVTDLDPLLRLMWLVPTPDDPRQTEIARWLLGRERAADWPVLATARLFDAHVWTKDRDFSGTGVRTWNNRTIRFLIESGLRDATADNDP
jgi:predicted nucleic acid-binding protein